MAMGTQRRETSVDVFVTEPFAFEEEYARALILPLREDLSPGPPI